ncbi:MAG: O-antigen ligase family protein [Melioribacteraceae bacterium]|nr:O-antigen ligase family protein [Melioribacteraceae bacterium]
MNQLNNKINNIDRLILSFLILFVATLNVSIFVNQIAFFSVYLLIGIKVYYLKENPFKKNILNREILFLIIVFLITALFSLYKEEALIRSTKKILLLPIIYSISYFADERKKTEHLIKTYLIASVLTSFIYLSVSIYHYLYHLYSLENKGPSPFQYVMTAGGLMSFSTIFIFSFLLNESTSKKIKLLLLIGFFITLFSVIASYTRAAWLGTIVGIIAVLIIQKQWKIIVPLIIIFITFALIKKSESKVEVYNIKGNIVEKIKAIETKGKANDVIIYNENKIIADYENGIITFDKDFNENKFSLNTPIANIKKWNDSIFVALSIDQRFYILKYLNKNYQVIDSFYTRGNTSNYLIHNQKLFISDEDSGFTIIKNPFHHKEQLFLKYKGAFTFEAYNTSLLIYNRENQSIFLANIINDNLINLDSLKINSSVGNIFSYDKRFILQTDKNLMLLEIINDKIKIVNSYQITGAIKGMMVDSSFYFATTNGEFYKLDKNLSVKNIYDFQVPVKSFYLNNDTLIITYFSQNRLNSIFDKYHITNFERLNIWKTGIKIFKENPILGVGDIDLQKVYKFYKEPYLKENYGHLHNNLINWLVLYGVVGTLIIIFFFVRVFLLLIKIYNKSKGEKYISSFVLASIASLIAFSFSGIGEYNFGDQEIMTVLWFIIGMNISFYKMIMEKK